MSSVVAWFIFVYIQMLMLGNFVSSLSVQFRFKSSHEIKVNAVRCPQREELYSLASQRGKTRKVHYLQLRDL